MMWAIPGHQPLLVSLCGADIAARTRCVSGQKAGRPSFLSQGDSDPASSPESCRRLWMRHLVSSEDLRKRLEKLQNSRRKKAAGLHKKAPPKRPKGLRAIATAGHRRQPGRYAGILDHARRGGELERHGAC